MVCNIINADLESPLACFVYYFKVVESRRVWAESWHSLALLSQV